MAEAFVVEVRGLTAGIVAKERNRFRFSASNPAMKSLEGRLFASLRDAELATDKVAETVFARLDDQRPAICRALC
jgi:hypothetical protein